MSQITDVSCLPQVVIQNNKNSVIQLLLFLFFFFYPLLLHLFMSVFMRMKKVCQVLLGLINTINYYSACTLIKTSMFGKSFMFEVEVKIIISKLTPLDTDKVHLYDNLPSSCPYHLFINLTSI